MDKKTDIPSPTDVRFQEIPVWDIPTRLFHWVLVVLVVVSFTTGAIGGNAAGAALKKYSLGTLGNTIAGLVGGGIGGQLIGTVVGTAIERWTWRLIVGMIAVIAGSTMVIWAN